MNIEFFNFMDLWKEKYDSFIMDRVAFKDESGKTHYFAYIYPKSSTKEFDDLKRYKKNDTIRFQRIKLEIEEVINLVKDIQIDEEKRTMIITYPDQVTYTFITEQFALEEEVRIKERYGNIGMYTPCYRLKAKASNSIFKDQQFSTASEIGYSDIITASKDIFKHNDKMFSKATYTKGVDYPLIIDLTHFEWNIKRFICFRNFVEIEISDMSINENSRPTGTINVEFTNGKNEMREVTFKEDRITEAFDHIIANVDFFLHSLTNTGFKGDLNIPIPGGKILDYQSTRKYSIQSESYINLDNLSPSDILKYIDDNENEIVEFKSVLDERPTESHYNNIAKQMTAMANAQARGLVIVGVSKSKVIEGVGDLSIDELTSNLQQALDANCDPWIDFERKEFELMSQSDIVKIYVVSLLASKKKRPYLFRKGKSRYELPLRRGDNTLWLTPKEIKDYMVEIHKEES